MKESCSVLGVKQDVWRQVKKWEVQFSTEQCNKVLQAVGSHSKVCHITNRAPETHQFRVKINHVPTKQKPTDVLSWGLTTHLLQGIILWLQGPKWIMYPRCFPSQKVVEKHNEDISHAGLDVAENQSPINELSPPVKLLHSNDLQVHLRIFHLIQGFVLIILFSEFFGINYLVMHSNQKQNLHTMIKSFREQTDPLPVDQTLIALCNLKYDQNRGLVVAQCWIWKGGNQGELIWNDLHASNHHCPAGKLLSIIRQHFYSHPLMVMNQTVVRHSVICRRERWRRPVAPPLAPLPHSRMRAVTQVGLETRRASHIFRGEVLI